MWIGDSFLAFSIRFMLLPFPEEHQAVLFALIAETCFWQGLNFLRVSGCRHNEVLIIVFE
jgi:hypothetical protein